MAQDYTNIDIDPPQLYQQYSPSTDTTFAPAPIEGTVNVTSINGISGPTVTIDGGASGYEFTPAGTSIVLTVANAETIRSSIGAAKSGANDNINTFTSLTGSTGWAAWTGGTSKVTHATYSGMASAGYVQAEVQGVMDALEYTTKAFKSLLDTLLASGVIKV